MSYQGNYELLVGQPPAFQNIQSIFHQQPDISQILYPGLPYLPNGLGSNLIPTLSHNSLPHTQQVPTSTTLPTACTSSLHPQQKKFRPPQKSQKYVPKSIPVELGNLKTYSNPDILICGNCRDLFDDVVDMLDHKKNYCKMRFTCKCEDKEEQDSGHDCVGQRAVACLPSSGTKSTSEGQRVCLQCSQCEKTYTGAWDLMFHVQSAHGINIYIVSDKFKKTVTVETGSAKLPTLDDRPQVNQSLSEVNLKEL